MKTFQLDLKEYIDVGLSKSSQESINRPGLDNLVNARVTNYGLETFDEPLSALTKSPRLLDNYNFDTDPTTNVNSPWTFSDSSVTYDSGTKTINFTGSGNDETATCTISTGQGIMSGGTYTCRLTIQDHTSGSVRVVIGTTRSTSVSANGTFKLPVVASADDGNVLIEVVGSATLKITSLEVYIDADDYTNVVGYPWGRYLHGDRNSLYAFAKRVWEVTGTHDYNDILNLEDESMISAYQSNAIGTLSDITLNDYGNAWIVYGNKGTLYKGNWTSINDDKAGKILWSPTPKVNAAISHLGRTVIGGINPTSFWNDDWKSLWERWRDLLPTDIILTEESWGYNYIVWSSVGEDLFWIQHPEIAVYGPMFDDKKYSPEYPYFFEMIRRNDIGWMALPTRGQVKRLENLGEHIVVYTENEVFAITPVMDPIPTYQIRKLLDFGIKDKNNVGVGNSENIFISMDSNLWKIKGDLSTERLGYTNHLSNLSTSYHTFINHNAVENEYYISNQNKSFLLTQQGLSEIETSIIDGYVTDKYRSNKLSLSTDSQFEFTTSAFDMDMRSIKKITYIDLGITTSSGKTIQTRVGSRTQTGGAFSYGPWVNVNNEGCAVVNVSGIDFKLDIRSATTEGFSSVKLSSAKISWQLSDKRMVRHNYAR